MADRANCLERSVFGESIAFHKDEDSSDLSEGSASAVASSKRTRVSGERTVIRGGRSDLSVLANV